MATVYVAIRHINSDIQCGLSHKPELLMRPSQGFWGTGEKGYLFQGNKGQILRGTGEQRQYWGTGNIRKQIFNFVGTGEQANLFHGNKGTGTPWEGLYNVADYTNLNAAKH